MREGVAGPDVETAGLGHPSGESAVTGVREGGGRCLGTRGVGAAPVGELLGETSGSREGGWRRQLPAGASPVLGPGGRRAGLGAHDWGEGKHVGRWKCGSFWFSLLRSLGLPDLP